MGGGIISTQEDYLMLRVAEGDERAFTELYTLWSRRVLSYSYKELRCTHESEDVVQETFIQLYRAAPTYRAEGKFSAFIFKIAGNLVRGRFRRRKPVDSLTQMLDEEEQEVPKSLRYSPEEALLGRIDFETALDLLPERQKEALLLVGEGLSYKEGADVLGVTPDAFAQLVLRARRALKKSVAGDKSPVKGAVGT